MVRSEKSPTLSMPKRRRTRRANSFNRGTVSLRSDAVSHRFPTRRVQGWSRQRVTPLGSVELASFLASLARCGFDGAAATTRSCTFHKSQRLVTKNTTPLSVKRGRKWDVLQNRGMASSAGAELNSIKKKYKKFTLFIHNTFWHTSSSSGIEHINCIRISLNPFHWFTGL